MLFMMCDLDSVVGRLTLSRLLSEETSTKSLFDSACRKGRGRVALLAVESIKSQHHISVHSQKHTHPVKYSILPVVLHDNG
jgi:hypothetical protein